MFKILQLREKKFYNFNKNKYSKKKKEAKVII